jgi:hypothetical protein
MTDPTQAAPDRSLPPLDIEPMPRIDLRHLFVLTDDTAILQHATLATPDLHHGYCTDDTARALIATVKLLALPSDLWVTDPETNVSAQDVLVITQRYLAFLAYAFNDDHGRFRNFMQYDRSWLEEIGSEDSHARTVWSLGKAYRYAPNQNIKDLAERLLRKALPVCEKFSYLRPMAYALLGVEEYLRVAPDDQMADRIHRSLAETLHDRLLKHREPDWPWWEDELTWGNAKLPHALMVAGRFLGREEYVQAGLKSLRWVLDIQTGSAGQLSIIGNRGWYQRGRKMAQYDQQPIEAKALVQACLAAAMITADPFWAGEARRCFEWFIGRNDAGLPLYNSETGGGQDGLLPEGVNENQGAESTLAYLLSVLELHLYQQASQGGEGFPTVAHGR